MHHDDREMSALGPVTDPLFSIPIPPSGNRRPAGCFTYHFLLDAPANQRCIPHRYTVRSSTFLKMTFSTVIPMRITVNKPAKTCAVSRFWLFS